MAKIILTLLLALGILSCNSSSSLQSKEAIRKAVIEHLSARKGLDLDMSAMELDIGEVSFRADEADASVAFRGKGSQTPAMTMKYSFVRDGNKWKVKPKAPGTATGEGGNPHGMAAPATPPPATPAGEMPPGHPPVEGKK